MAAEIKRIFAQMPWQVPFAFVVHSITNFLMFVAMLVFALVVDLIVHHLQMPDVDSRLIAVFKTFEYGWLVTDLTCFLLHQWMKIVKTWRETS